MSVRGHRLAALVLAGVVGVSGCGEDWFSPRRPFTTQAATGERVPDQIIENGTHTVTREGVKKAVMVARRISFFNLEGKVEADTMEVTFFDENGIQESRLNALHGEIDQRTNDLVARGKVLVLAEGGSRIDGEELRYDSARDLIVSDKPVTILRNGNRIRGANLETDPGLTNIRLTGSSAVLKDERSGRRSRAAEREPTAGRETPANAPPSAAAPPGPSPSEAPSVNPEDPTPPSSAAPGISEARPNPGAPATPEAR